MRNGLKRPGDREWGIRNRESEFVHAPFPLRPRPRLRLRLHLRQVDRTKRTYTTNNTATALPDSPSSSPFPSPSAFPTFPHPSTPILALTLLLLAAFLLTACSSSSDENASSSGAIAFGTIGRQPGQFSRPRAVAITRKNEIIAIDRSGRIQAYDVKTAKFLRQWLLPAYEKGTPTGMSIDPTDDTIWVADTHYYRILQYNSEGKLLFKFGEEGEEPGKFIFPTDVTPDPDGKTLWITEYGRRNRIMQFTRTGEFIQEWGPELYDNDELQRPMAVAVSPDGKSLYVVDAGNHRINVYDRQGKVLFRFGKIGTAPGEMKFPLDMAIAPDNTIYVIEYENSRVSRYTLDGTFLGCWGEPGKKPGQLFFPWGCAVGPDGDLVIADTNNQRLQLVHDPAEYFVSSNTLVAAHP